MKDKILLFIIGVLVGAVISTGAFFVYTKATTCNNSNNNQTMQMPGGTPPNMNGNQNNGNGQPPERPDGNNQNANTEEVENSN